MVLDPVVLTDLELAVTTVVDARNASAAMQDTLVAFLVGEVHRQDQLIATLTAELDRLRGLAP
jgi:hypothetical protein